MALESITNLSHPSFSWLHEPSSWNVDDSSGTKEGSKGSHSFSPDGSVLVICPPAFKDFWRRTYYSPTLIKGDASGLLTAVPALEECTVQVDFELTAVNQFDQAGILIYLDKSHWVKAGIEFCDGMPRLSCVVCNIFSDWSTQPWPTTSARLRVHKILQGSTVAVEAAPLMSDDFQFFRIAHLSALASHKGADLETESTGADEELPWRLGPFAACPMEQRGCSARFFNFKIGPKLDAVHSNDASTMA